MKVLMKSFQNIQLFVLIFATTQLKLSFKLFFSHELLNWLNISSSWTPSQSQSSIHSTSHSPIPRFASPANLQFHRPDMFQLRQFSKRTKRMAAAADALSSFHHHDSTKKRGAEESYYVLSDEKMKKEWNLSLIILMKIFFGSRSGFALLRGFAIASRDMSVDQKHVRDANRSVFYFAFRAPIVSLPHSFSLNSDWLNLIEKHFEAFASVLSHPSPPVSYPPLLGWRKRSNLGYFINQLYP